MTVLAADRIGFGYRDHGVLDGISLAAGPGRVMTVLGPNGAGKTTLLKCLNGLLKPSVGRVTLDGVPLAALARRQRASLMAYVPQAESLQFPISVFDAVLLGRRPHMGWAPRRSDLAIVGEAIERVGIAALAHRDARRLSGGELQLVAVAKAIAQQPRVLLLDEPTAHLDLRHQQRVLRLVRHVADALNVTVVQSIHDINHALAVSDEVAVLSAGSMVATGGPECIDAALVDKVYRVSCDVIDHDGRRLVVPHSLAR